MQLTSLRGKSLEAEFWEPNAPASKFKGVLLIDEENNGVLTLAGAMHSLRSMDRTGIILFGTVRSHYVYKLTLFSIVLVRSARPHLGQNELGEGEAKFETNSILLGSHISSEDLSCVYSALLLPTGLAEWCNKGGFVGKVTREEGELATETVNVSFTATASPQYDVGSGRSITFLSQYDGPVVFEQEKLVVLKEYNTIRMTFSSPISIRELIQEIQIWQTFLTIALRRASYTNELRLGFSNGSDFSSALIVPGRKGIEFQRNRRQQALFDQSKLGTRIGIYLKYWRDQQQKIEIPILLFSASYYQPQSYVHATLLSCLQALEILHREQFDSDRFPDETTRKDTIQALRDAIPPSLDLELRKELASGIGFIGSLSLFDRLRDFHDKYRTSLAPLFPRAIEDMRLLKNVRNFLTHYGTDRSFTKEFLTSREILVLTEKTKLFVEICLLGTMGMSDAEIKDLLCWFEPYVGWSRESHLWPPVCVVEAAYPSSGPPTAVSRK